MLRWQILTVGDDLSENVLAVHGANETGESELTRTERAAQSSSHRHGVRPG
jgi:hypothetical protein